MCGRTRTRAMLSYPSQFLGLTDDLTRSSQSSRYWATLCRPAPRSNPASRSRWEAQARFPGAVRALMNEMKRTLDQVVGVRILASQPK